MHPPAPLSTANGVSRSTDSQVSTSSGTPGSTSTHPAVSSQSNLQVPLIGGVIGGIVALVLLAAAFLLWRRQRQRHAESLPSPVIEDEEKIGDEEESPELESSSP
jgi:hypothetical protein